MVLLPHGAGLPGDGDVSAGAARPPHDEIQEGVSRPAVQILARMLPEVSGGAA